MPAIPFFLRSEGYRYRPGHYASMMRGQDAIADMEDAQVFDVGVKRITGYVLRFTWLAFETSLNNYNGSAWAELQSKLDWCATNGYAAIVQIEHRTFGYADNIPNPPYLNNWTGLIPQTGDMIADGYTIAIFDPFVVTRLKALLTQFAAQFGDHPALEGVMLEETALGTPESQWFTPPVGKNWQPYTIVMYRDALIEYMAHWKTLVPSVRWFFYLNFMAGNTTGTYLNAAIQASDNCVVCGPDAQELDATLQNRTFWMYRDNKDIRPIATFASTRVYNTAVTGPQIYDFCINDLGANYMCWVFQYDGAPNWVNKAVPQILAHPTFNVEDWT